MPKIWLPKNVREALNPSPIVLVQKQNPRVKCDLTVYLTETSFEKARKNKRLSGTCRVCGRRSASLFDVDELYFCGQNCFQLYKSKYGVPKKFTRGFN